MVNFCTRNKQQFALGTFYQSNYTFSDNVSVWLRTYNVSTYLSKSILQKMRLKSVWEIEQGYEIEIIDTISHKQILVLSFTMKYVWVPKQFKTARSFCFTSLIGQRDPPLFKITAQLGTRNSEVVFSNSCLHKVSFIFIPS